MSTPRAVCYACHEPVHAPVCVGCGVLQPPPAQPDPFVVFGLERRYHLDLSVVEAKYRALQRQTHPDRFATKPAVERRMALQWTAAINEARRVLRDDRLRARFLATGQAAPSERGPKLDPAFLAEMFEWREREEEEPGAMRTLAVAAQSALLGELDTLFSSWEAGQGSLESVDDRLSRLKYVEGLLQPVDF